MNKWIKLILVLFILVGLVAGARVYGLDQRLESLTEWIGAQGIWGPFIFAIVYAIATVLSLPGSVMTVAAGAIFGSLVGVVTVICGATLGASLAFLIARYLARDAVAEAFYQNEKFGKLNRLTEKNGAIIVAITRLIPLFPFNMLNYAFGLTKVPFVTYVGWSGLCMLPGTILYVVGTDAVTTSAKDGQVPWLLVGVVIFVLGLLSVLAKTAKSKLNEE